MCKQRQDWRSMYSDNTKIVRTEKLPHLPQWSLQRERSSWLQYSSSTLDGPTVQNSTEVVNVMWKIHVTPSSGTTWAPGSGCPCSASWIRRLTSSYSTCSSNPCSTMLGTAVCWPHDGNWHPLMCSAGVERAHFEWEIGWENQKGQTVTCQKSFSC